MNHQQQKYLKKLKRRKEKVKEARSVKGQPFYKSKDYALGRLAIFTIVGIVIGVVILLNIFK